MKIMTCPINGPRNISEFAYGGEFRPAPSGGADASAWADYLYISDNRPGIAAEWWLHVPTSTWFIAERNLRSDEILKTYLPPSSAVGSGP